MENFSDFIISDSNKREDYEIFIKKKKENNFIAYCPQLNKLVKGNNFEKVYYLLDLAIYEHIKSMYPDFEYTQISLSDKLGVDNINIKSSAHSSILIPTFTSEIEEEKIENLKTAYDFLQKTEAKNEPEQYEENDKNIIFAKNIPTPEIEKENDIPLFNTEIKDDDKENEKAKTEQKNKTDTFNEQVSSIKTFTVDTVEEKETVEENSIIQVDNTVKVDNTTKNNEAKLEKKLDVEYKIDADLTQKKYVRKKLEAFKQYSQQEEILSR